MGGAGPQENKPAKNRLHKSLPNVHPTNSMVLPDGKIFKVQKKRQRKIHSCIPCHQRKIRCSREKPTCNNCLKLAEKNPAEEDEIIEACKYFDNDKKKNLKIKGVEIEELQRLPSESEGSQSVSAVGTAHERNIQHASPSRSYLNPINDYYGMDDQPLCRQEYQSKEDSFEMENGSEKIDSEISDRGNQNIHENEHEHTLKDVNSSEFPFDSTDFIYIPRKDTLAFLPTEENYACQDLNSSNFQLNSMYYENQVCSQYAKQFASQFVPILNSLPTKDRSDELLKTFQVNIHSLLPILDMDSFVEKYNEFWYCGMFLTDNIERLYEYNIYFKDKDDTEIPEKINDFLYWHNKTNETLNPSNLSEFLILLFAMYYTSMASSVYEFLSKKYDNFNSILTYKNEVNKYYNVFKKMNNKGLNNPRVMSLAVLQINVLVQSIINLKSGNSLISITKILRISQFYQFNRDPVLYHGLKETNLVQTRRMVWWQIFFLDNLVSFFLHLPPSVKLSDFDTSLLMENLDNHSSSHCTIMYLNCMYRFTLVVDELSSLTNGLSGQLRDEDVTKLKNSIKNLFITCTMSKNRIKSIYLKQVALEIKVTSGNKEFNNLVSENTGDKGEHTIQHEEYGANENGKFNPQLNSKTSDYHNSSKDTLEFFISFLDIICDKLLIMLQKKILINPYVSRVNTVVDENLNLKLQKLRYNYTDLQSNLLPSLVNYLNVFLVLSKKDMQKYNWKLKNFIPIDELILLMQILATNYKSGMSQVDTNELHDINLKIYLVDQTINSLKLNWHLKLSSVNKLIFLASKMWELMILKFNIDLAVAYSLSEKFVFPTAVNENTAHNNPIQKPISSDSVNCAEIAPRSLGLASAMDTPLNTKKKSLFNPVSSTGEVSRKNYALNMNVNVKDRFLKVAREVEDELLKEGGAGVIQDINEDEEGWYNLGTEEEYGLNSIDDFHFYKNLKSDVVRLFKLVVC